MKIVLLPRGQVNKVFKVSLSMCTTFSAINKLVLHFGCPIKAILCNYEHFSKFFIFFLNHL